MSKIIDEARLLRAAQSYWRTESRPSRQKRLPLGVRHYNADGVVMPSSPFACVLGWRTDCSIVNGAYR
jgi:hypothetical protein